VIREETLSKIGRFTKPHGTKGELTLLTTNGAFGDGKHPPYIFCELEGLWVPFFIQAVRRKGGGGGFIVKPERINSDAEAQELARHEVFIPAEMVEPEEPEEDSEYQALIGYTVYDSKRGVLGMVTDTDETTDNVLLQVDCNGKEVLLPAAAEWLTAIDDDLRRITVSLPDGFLEL
jgi:16S rRNA processing protein RimM